MFKIAKVVPTLWLHCNTVLLHNVERHLPAQIQTLHCSYKNQNHPVGSPNYEWAQVYHYPYVKTVKVISRLKLYQTLFMVASVPYSTYIYSLGKITSTALDLIIGVSVFSCVTLYAYSYYFRRLIGFIYINKNNENLLKISHLTFWGNRKDVVTDIDDIVPLSDCNQELDEPYLQLERYSSKEYLFFTLKYGKILDKFNFERIFGSVE